MLAKYLAVGLVKKGAASSAKLARGNTHRMKDFPLAEFQLVALVAAQGPGLKSRNDFGQGIAVRCPKQIKQLLKPEMKWNRRKIDVCRLCAVVQRHSHLRGHRY
jgi:hypothetical protein